MKYTFHIFRNYLLFVALFMMSCTSPHPFFLHCKKIMCLFFYISFLLITIINHENFDCTIFWSIPSKYRDLRAIKKHQKRKTTITILQFLKVLQFLKFSNFQFLKVLHFSRIFIRLLSKPTTFKLGFQNLYATLRGGVRDIAYIFQLWFYIRFYMIIFCYNFLLCYYFLLLVFSLYIQA